MKSRALDPKAHVPQAVLEMLALGHTNALGIITNGQSSLSLQCKDGNLEMQNAMSSTMVCFVLCEGGLALSYHVHGAIFVNS